MNYYGEIRKGKCFKKLLNVDQKVKYPPFYVNKANYVTIIKENSHRKGRQ